MTGIILKVLGTHRLIATLPDKDCSLDEKTEACRGLVSCPKTLESWARTAHETFCLLYSLPRCEYGCKQMWLYELRALQSGVCGVHEHGLDGIVVSNTGTSEGNEASLVSSGQHIVQKLCLSALIHFPVASNCLCKDTRWNRHIWLAPPILFLLLLSCFFLSDRKGIAIAWHGETRKALLCC